MDIIDAGPLETDWLVYRNLGSERVGAVGDGLGYQSRAARMIGTSDLILQSWCFGAGSPGMADCGQAVFGTKLQKADIGCRQIARLYIDRFETSRTKRYWKCTQVSFATARKYL